MPASYHDLYDGGWRLKKKGGSDVLGVRCVWNYFALSAKKEGADPKHHSSGRCTDLYLNFMVDAGGQVAFVLGGASTSRLQIGSSSRVPISTSHASTLSGCSFESSSVRIGKRGKSPLGSSAFASMSIQLPCFAATTLAPPKGKDTTAVSTPADPPKKKKTFAEVVEFASKKALQGGIPGMVAMGLQVLTLMWLR